MVKLFVGNLPPSASNQSLKEIFQQYKDLQDFKLISNYGFVYLESEESAIHAVNNLNGLEYRGFPLSIDFARDHNKLKRKAELMLENRNVKAFIPPPLPPPPRFVPPVSQQRNLNPYNLPFLSNNNNSINRSFENLMERRYASAPYNNGFDTYHDEYERKNNLYGIGDFYDSPMAPLHPQDYYDRPPISKKMKPDSFIDDDFYDYSYNLRQQSDLLGSDMYRSSSMHMLKRPTWYEMNHNHNNPNRHFLSSERDQQMFYPRRGNRHQMKKSYIDEYEDSHDYSDVDPYPTYLKQYQK